MDILILQQLGKPAHLIQKRLKLENIRTELVTINNIEPNRILEKIGRCHGVIFYVKSPSHREALDVLPSLSKKIKIPMICIDESDNLETELLTKKYGIDFYFSPPYSFSEIAIRMKMLVYRKARSNNGLHMVRVGNLTLNFLTHELKKNNTPVPLRSREYALLEFFMLNPGKVLPRNLIIEQLWDRNSTIVSNCVDVHISRLRQKIEAGSEKYFDTIRSVGYRFNPPRERKKTVSDRIEA